MRLLPFILFTVCMRMTAVAPPEVAPGTETAPEVAVAAVTEAAPEVAVSAVTRPTPEVAVSAGTSARPEVAVRSEPEEAASDPEETSTTEPATTAAPATTVPCQRTSDPQFVPLPGKAVAIAARQSHACAVLKTGRVWCWGNNEFEQAGSTNRAPAVAPHDIGLDHVVEVSLGYSSGCARHIDGTTTCWGRKTSRNESSPDAMAAKMPAGRKVRRVSAGHDHVCAIVRGAVECYGSLGGFAGFPAEQPVVPGVAGATAIAAGMDTDCALAGGTVACWGQPWGRSCEMRCEDDRQGESCQRQCERERQRPVAHRVPGIADATAITVGDTDACAVRKNGHVVCWGSINGLAVRFGTPQEVPQDITDLDDARQVASGGHHACAVRESGYVACWGDGAFGIRGDGDTDEVSHWPTTVAGIDSAIAVAAGLDMSCALLDDGRVTCWGMNDHGQLGFATRGRSDAPVEVCGLEGVTQLAATESTTCALVDGGTVLCWGAGWMHRNHTGVPAGIPYLFELAQLAANDGTFCGRDRSGQVKCWGQQIVPIPPGPMSHVAVGRFGACAARTDGTVVCAGNTVTGIPMATKVAVGDDFACAANDREVTCWGPKTFPPTLGGRYPYVAVVAVDETRRSVLGKDIIDLAAVPGGYCALTRDGHAHCARSAEVIREDAPEWPEHPWSTKTPNPPGVVQVVKGRNHACALRADSHVVCWGDNQFGQLGTGSIGLVVAPAH